MITSALLKKNILYKEH